MQSFVRVEKPFHITKFVIYLEVMNSSQLLQARQNKHWEQIETAEKLGVSQSYLSLLESGKREITKKISHRAIKIFRLSACALPIEKNLDETIVGKNDELTKDLGTLGYPKFAFLKSNVNKNPLEVLFLSLKTENLESRLVEALPWLVFTFSDLDWETLFKLVKINDLQNKLGFVISLARKSAERLKDRSKMEFLCKKELELSNSRLFQEAVFSQNLTETEKKWLKNNRSKDAKFWRVLSDLEIKHFDYGP
jgi:transcriptional regulator with XRE-family HTH domain